MTKRISKAIDIFLDAINNGTLAKGSPCGCAIGNLIVHELGAKYERDESGVLSCNNINAILWTYIVETVGGIQFIRKINMSSYYMKGLEIIDFTFDEICQIEKTFETNCNIHQMYYFKHSKEEIRKDQIKGLEAVVKLMLTFDEVERDVKEIFTNKAELIEV